MQLFVSIRFVNVYYLCILFTYVLLGNKYVNVISMSLALSEPFSTFQCHYDIDGLVQELHNSIANALELRLSCTNLSICLCHFNQCFQKQILHVGPNALISPRSCHHRASPTALVSDQGLCTGQWA